MAFSAQFHSAAITSASASRSLVFIGPRTLPRFRSIRLRAAQDISSVRATPPEFAAARRTLGKAIDEAVKREDYKAAASLKRELELLNEEDPTHALRNQLAKAVQSEDYQEAMQLQAQLKELEAQIGAHADSNSSGSSSSSNLPTSVTTTTNGIKVKVASSFRPTESAPHLSQFFFSYRVTITNESKAVVQLRSRHWAIMDGAGHKEEVRGAGVVGEQPILMPGKSFEYGSGCPLRTPIGTMEGEYTMVVLDDKDGEWKETFEAKIGPFKLSMKGE